VEPLAPPFVNCSGINENYEKSPVLGGDRMKPDPLLWPVKILPKPLLIFSTKRRSVGLQHCAFLAVFGIFWLGGKFSHAKTSIEHKRRYAHRFSERFSKNSAVRWVKDFT
jgi:hypothetical protein